MEEKKSLKEKLSEKFADAKMAVRQKVDKTIKWVEQNPELSVAIATVAIPATCKTVKSISHAVEAKADERHRKLTTYDRRSDEYLHLRRPLKAREQEELALRMDRGESKTMILRDMNLLKW